MARATRIDSLTYDAALAAFGAAGDPWSLYVNTTTKKFTQEFRVASHENQYSNGSRAHS